MKKFIIFISVFLSLFVLSFTSKDQIKRVTEEVMISITPKPIVDFKIEFSKSPLKIPKKNHEAFLNALGHKESGNKYNVVNQYGYMGRYQFGKRTLKGLGYKVSREEFLNDPILQEKAMQDLLEANYDYLYDYIEQYNGDTVNGIVITESGLLAAAHLGGAYSVKKWLEKGKVKKDAFGTSITNYMVQFGGYELNLNNGIN